MQILLEFQRTGATLVSGRGELSQPLVESLLLWMVWHEAQSCCSYLQQVGESLELLENKYDMGKHGRAMKKFRVIGDIISAAS